MFCYGVVILIFVFFFIDFGNVLLVVLRVVFVVGLIIGLGMGMIWMEMGWGRVFFCWWFCCLKIIGCFGFFIFGFLVVWLFLNVWFWEFLVFLSLILSLFRCCLSMFFLWWFFFSLFCNCVCVVLRVLVWIVVILSWVVKVLFWFWVWLRVFVRVFICVWSWVFELELLFFGCCWVCVCSCCCFCLSCWICLWYNFWMILSLFICVFSCEFLLCFWGIFVCLLFRGEVWLLGLLVIWNLDSCCVWNCLFWFLYIGVMCGLYMFGVLVCEMGEFVLFMWLLVDFCDGLWVLFLLVRLVLFMLVLVGRVWFCCVWVGMWLVIWWLDIFCVLIVYFFLFCKIRVYSFDVIVVFDNVGFEGVRLRLVM